MVSKKTAIQIKEQSLKAIGQLDRMLYEIREQCSEDDFYAVRRGVGYAIATIIDEILEPVYQAYPEIDDLKNESFRPN